MKRIEWESNFSNNAIVVLSAPRPGEEGVARRLVDDLHQIKLGQHDFLIEHVILRTRQHLVETMHQLARRAKKGLRPILHLDMHGDTKRGLEIAASGEFAGWQEVFAWLRKINLKTGNNLGVVGAACYSLSLIRSVSIFQPVPFYFLVAPEGIVSIATIDQRMPHFYKTLLASIGIGQAVAELGPQFSLFHCEKMMTIVLARYMKQQCKGRGLTDRKERLLTEALQSGLPRTTQNLRWLRRSMQDQLRPTDELIQRYANRFLCGRTYSVTLQELLNFIQ
jgi:hypothetical protein